MDEHSAVAIATTDPRSASHRAPATAARFYRPELDGLRFFAFFGVFVHHILPHRPAEYAAAHLPPPAADVFAALVRSGGFGVDLFFVLSAFLITELLLREHESCGRINIPAFLSRRALRIWPLFFIFIALSLGADHWLHRGGLARKYLIGFVALAGNWTCAFFGYPDSVAAPLWSVSVEEQFYLLFPLVLAFIGPARLRTLGVSLLAVGAVSRALTVIAGTRHPAVWCSTPCRVDTIGIGVLIAVALRGRTSWAPRMATRALLATGGLALWVVAELIAPVTAQTLAGVTISYPMVYVGAGSILLAALGARETLLSSALFVALGRISFGLYVYHVLAIAIANIVVSAIHGGLMMLFVIALMRTTAMATVSFRVLETPFLNLKKRFTIVPSRD